MAGGGMGEGDAYPSPLPELYATISGMRWVHERAARHFLLLDQWLGVGAVLLTVAASGIDVAGLGLSGSRGAVLGLYGAGMLTNFAAVAANLTHRFLRFSEQSLRHDGHAKRLAALSRKIQFGRGRCACGVASAGSLDLLLEKFEVLRGEAPAVPRTVARQFEETFPGRTTSFASAPLMDALEA